MKLTEAYTRDRLENIRKLYRSAFPAREQKPFNLILRKRRGGTVEILAIEDDLGGFMGLAISALYGDIVLLDYFAIAEEKRGAGAGSAALALIKERYSGKRLFLEIESTEGGAENMENRRRRKAFYQKNGFSAMPYCVCLYGVDMEIMYSSGEVPFEDYHRLYKNVFGKEYARRLKLKQ